MNINEVKDLLDKFDSSSLTEFDLKEGNSQLYMSKNKTSAKSSATSNETVQQPVEKSVQQADGDQIEALPKASTPAETAAEKAGHIVASPIVGVAYLKPAPDQEPFKTVGDTVKKGDILCIIEAMKLMNEIISEYDGVVEEVLVQNEDVVEFNQPLFRIG